MEVAISTMPKNVEQFVMLFDASKWCPPTTTTTTTTLILLLRKKQTSENEIGKKQKRMRVINEKQAFVKNHRASRQAEGHTECVRSAPETELSKTPPGFNLMVMLERVLLGIEIIIDIPYQSWSISIFNASLNYAIVAAEENNPLFSFLPFASCLCLFYSRQFLLKLV